MLMRALDLAAERRTGTFSDVPDGVFFTGAVEAIAAAGITTGCGGGKFCPFDQVLRDQMASFIARAFGLAPIIPPPRATDLAVVEVAAGFEAPGVRRLSSRRPAFVRRRSGRSHLDRPGRQPIGDSLHRSARSGAIRRRTGPSGSGVPPGLLRATAGSSSTTRTMRAIPGSSSTRLRPPTPMSPIRRSARQLLIDRPAGLEPQRRMARVWTGRDPLHPDGRRGWRE